MFPNSKRGVFLCIFLICIPIPSPAVTARNVPSPTWHVQPQKKASVFSESPITVPELWQPELPPTSEVLPILRKNISGGEQFYALDLDALAAVSKEISGRAVEEFQLENGHVSVSCTAADSSSLLYLSIPYDKGWKIYRNGQQITAGLLDNCMYSIPLTEGKNQIELRYTCPGIRAGILLSVSGILLTLLISLLEHKNRLQKNKL